MDVNYIRVRVGQKFLFVSLHFEVFRSSSVNNVHEGRLSSEKGGHRRR